MGRRSRRSIVRCLGGGIATLALLLIVPSCTDASDDSGGPHPNADRAAEGPVREWGTVIGTDGRVYLADAQRRAITFRGFGAKANDGDGNDAFTDDVFETGGQRGFKLARVGTWWSDLEPTRGQYDDDELEKLVETLDLAAEHGFQVILDMHQNVFGEAFESRGVPAWATRADGLAFEKNDNWILSNFEPAVMRAWTHLYEDPDLQQAQIDMWLHIVERVKDHPALLGYDLLNEPFGEVLPGESMAEAMARVEADQLTPMYQRLTDAISAADPDHWVFIQPTIMFNQLRTVSLGEVTGPKVAFYPHLYDPAIELATYTAGGVIEYDPAFIDAWATAAEAYARKHSIPMLVGEWGVARPDLDGMDRFVAETLASLEEITSGWTVWSACLGEGYCPWDEEGNARPVVDQVLQPYARAVAGIPISSTWRAEARQLVVRFRDGTAAGPTELWVDAPFTYPDGWEVVTSDPDGTWSTTYDPGSGMVSVTTERTGGDHAICIQPEGASLRCKP